MEEIIIQKQGGIGIRKDGKMVRISLDVDERLEKLSEETGYTKTRLADYLLSMALDAVKVVEGGI